MFQQLSEECYLKSVDARYLEAQLLPSGGGLVLLPEEQWSGANSRIEFL